MVIYRVSTVYLPYIYRVSTVIDREKIGEKEEEKEAASKRK